MTGLTDRELAALDWVRRIDDPAFAAWDDHIAWLEADPANAAAFDRMALAVDDVAGPVPAKAPAAVPANDNPLIADPTPARWRGAGWLGGAVAAGLLGLVGISQFDRGAAPSGETRTIGSSAGERRLVRLGDGTRIALNGNSAIALDPARPRTVALLGGEAYFEVVHNATQPLSVTVGDTTFRDVGTAFNVSRDGDDIRLAVREGEVMLDPDGSARRLRAGQQVVRTGTSTTMTSVDPSAVGGWRVGRLVYRDAPLDRIAHDLSRAIGQTVVVAPGDATRFTGTVAIDADRERTVRRFAAVAGVEVRRYKTEWRLGSGDR